ncbi:MAG: prepilin-type N-terminal cleavage/methylation domain-containing protein [Planctomycetes bacterium]|nr:prepilin-type N-terminal cleavage/methylation domain-containing protein [Planctomycetota bacterium]
MNKLQKNFRHARRGFTLIESIATIIILAIIGSMASMIIVNAVDGYVDAATEAQLHMEASTAMDRIVRELRKIPLDAAAAGIAPDIDDVTDTSITLATGTQIILVGNKLQIANAGPPLIDLLDDVTAFSVQTYDESNTDLAATLTGAACDPIRRISLDLTLQRAGATATLRTKLFIRPTMIGGGT